MGRRWARIWLSLTAALAEAGTPTELLPEEQDCAQTYEHTNLVCEAGHELFRYTQLDSGWNSMSSCATCTCKGYTGTNPQSLDNPKNEYYNTGPECCSGWNGTECDICQSKDACPPIDVDGNGTMAYATQCTHDLMVPVNGEEAAMGKKFSCVCGGGLDNLSPTTCPLQGVYATEVGGKGTGSPVTRFDWVFKGYGTAASPGKVTLSMNAGIHGNTWASADAPSEFMYFYPIVWSGDISGCVISKGKCMNVPGTDVKSQDCYNYVCEDTQISCPPAGLPSCPGGADNCGNVPGTNTKYQMHKCTVTPENNVGFQISCLEKPNPGGAFVCYYQQPGGYSPLSMTCDVGNCLYNMSNTSKIDYDETDRFVPLGLAWQLSLLIVITASVLGGVLGIEVLRRSWDSKNEETFRRHQRRRDVAAAALAAADEAMDLIPSPANPLLPPREPPPVSEEGDLGSKKPRSRGSDGALSTASGSSVVSALITSDTGPGSAASTGMTGVGPGFGDDVRPKQRSRSDSVDSGHGGGHRYKGATLSWHGMKLWVPAKSSDQLSSLHAKGVTRFAELQRNMGAGPQVGGLEAVDEESGPMSPRSPGSPPLEPPLSPRGRTAIPLPAVSDDHAHSLETQILRSVNGTARRGGLTALMGPSGAGKTSLLDCLAQRKPMHRVEGVVRVNGRPCTPSTMRAVSGYVPQHDVLPGVLTVREHLLFHARLRCPPSMNDRDRRERVHDVIANLGLTKCADTQIGNEFKRGLSGGEKRRVSVAEELVVEPGILFLDEPTTGLDSTTAFSIVRTLGDIARRGTTVLLSIHQPREDIFDLFDRVLVLCEGGRVVFEGHTAAVPAYLRRGVDMGFVHIPKVDAFLHLHAAALAKAMGQPPVEDHAIGASSRNRRKARRSNPADLLLDVASCALCHKIADAVADGTFAAGQGPALSVHRTTGLQSQGAAGLSASLPSWEDAVGPVNDSTGSFDGGPRLRDDDDDDDSYDAGARAGGGRMVTGDAGDDDTIRLVNGEDPNPLWRMLVSPVLALLGMGPKEPADDFFPPRHVANPLLQLAVLSERLIRTAARHPMLVALQYGGALFLAVCLGFIFQDLSNDLYGIQDRIGLLFFIPFCLVLLGMSSLPVWRDEHILFTHEQGNKRIYGFPAYFMSVLLFDIVLVRTIPPTFFALITYNLAGLNKGCDYCLLYFTIILIFTNIISALISMAVGAFRFSTSFSNLIGALLALLFALFAGFLVSKKSMEANVPFYLADPLAYSYEALLINQFGNEITSDGNEFFYIVNGSWCAPGLPTITATGNMILSTFGFSNKNRDMVSDIYTLWTGTLWCAALAFGVLVASAQAPYYAAAWQRFCQVDPLGLLGALISAGCSRLMGISSGAGGDDHGGGGGGGRGSESERDSSLVDGDSSIRGGSTSSMRGERTAHNKKGFEKIPTTSDGARGGGSNRDRHGTGSGSFEVPSDEEEKDTELFPDTPRARIVSFDDEREDASGNRVAAAAAAAGRNESAPAVVPAPSAVDAAAAEEARCAALAGLLAAQLAHPLGAPHPVTGQVPSLPPPMVLSFHEVCLSVPHPTLSLAKTLLGGNVPDSAVPAAVLVPLSATLETGVIGLGMNVMRSPESGLAVVRQIMPKSWAQRKGVRPGDAVVGVGGQRLKSYDDLAPALAAAPRPVKVDFLRRRHAAPRSPGSIAAPSGRQAPAASEGQPPTRAAKAAAWAMGQHPPGATPASIHAGRKVILQSVSGSTLSSVNALKTPRPVAGRTPKEPRLPAMVCGIMGPSGAGKTSLLDCLAGRKTVGAVTGDVRLNGRSMTPTEMRQLSGYVVQEDILPASLTVRECLDFQAKLRVPVASAASGRVLAVMKRMKLVRNAGTIVGGAFRRGISGGEKRRVSVAIELLSEPAILFLDEPTTGQDSTTAVMLCKALKQIARDGTTVVMSIHQPRIDIFEMMTQIVFMTKEGRVAYCGPTDGLAAYLVRDLAIPARVAAGLKLPGAFASPRRQASRRALLLASNAAAAGIEGPPVPAEANSNPADDLLDAMAVLEPQLLVDCWNASVAGLTQRKVLALLVGALSGGSTGIDGDRLLLERLVAQRGKHRSSWLFQSIHLSLRAMRNTLRNPFPFFLHGVTAVVTALALGFVFKNIHDHDNETAGTQDRFGIMFFLVLYLSLLSLTSLPIWRDDQQLFVAERGSGIYDTSPYVLAAMLFDVLPYRILPPLAFAFISYPMIELNDGPGRQERFFLVLFAANLTVSGVCMLIGVLTTSNAAANAAGSLAMLTSLLFCGFLLNKDSIPDGFSFLVWWSPASYAYEALVYNEFDGLQDLYITTTISKSTVSAGPFTGAEIAHCFKFLDEVGYDTFMLLIMAAGYFALVLAVMQIFVKEKR